MPSVCLFGQFDIEHPRNRQVDRAFRGVGWDVVTARAAGPFRTRRRRLLAQVEALRCDLIWVGFPGYRDVSLAKVHARRRGVPLLFDAYYSLYDGSILDRGRFHRVSARAAYLRGLEIGACHLADRVIVDTAAHAARFRQRMHLRSHQIEVLPVGSDNEGAPRPAPAEATSLVEDLTKVVFAGSFIPLHGVETIIRAAAILDRVRPEVRFTLIGEGQTREAAEQLARDQGCTNLTWLPNLDRDELNTHLIGADIALGVFGSSVKADLVIPNKVVDALALGVPVITCASTAATEALRHGHDSWLCRAGSPEALAEAVARLAGDRALRRRLAEAGQATFDEEFSAPVLQARLREILDRAGRGRRR